MRLLVLVALVLTIGSTPTNAAETVVPPPPDAKALAEAPRFAPDEPIVATHYFYWYKWPDEHFFVDARQERFNIRHHFPDNAAVSYESAAWHRKQMEDLRAAGIDVALCIHWGTPNNYDKPDLRFSVRGLPPLVQALDELAKDGRPVPRLGLFFDTSTLLGEHAFREPGRGRVDLRTDEGKDIFYRTIRDFFCFVPPRHWACVGDRPLVQLYGSSFAAGHDASTLDYVYEHFARDFGGRKPLIVGGPSWSFKADLSTGWGAALSGPLGEPPAVQIGPGYDDSPVPGRTTPTRDRLGGGFYAASWLIALQQQPKLVILETWSELHEGTPICETLEDGRFYIDLTRKYSDLLKAGRQPAAADWAEGVRRLLAASPSNRGGREFSGRRVLRWDVEARESGGLRLVRQEDGEFEKTAIEGTPCVRTRPGVSPHRYLYFDVADPYYYDHRGQVAVRITYWDDGRTPLVLEYDSAVETGSLADCYRAAEQRIERTGTKTWKTAVVRLPQARCANRQNGGTDFRLTPGTEDVAIRSVEFTKLRDGFPAE